MINTTETIFALSTVFGKSGVAVIRISGHSALKVLEHFKIKKKIKPRFATLVDLVDSYNQLVDSGIIIYFPAPNSFTGEDVIELQVHGSKAVIKILLAELSKIFIMAKPGEFSLRAFLNGKFDLTQIEGIADLIDAETTMQARQAIKQITGELERLYSSWRQILLSVQSKIEAYIDFPEELQENDLTEVSSQVATLTQSIKHHLDDNRLGERLREGLHVVITGKPNVGKSTLFNYLAKRDIAIISKYAGTTRDVLEAHIDIDGYPIILSDTAGIRESSDPIELEGINRARKRFLEADLKIELFSFEERFNINPNSEQSDTIYVLSKADDLTENKIIKIGNAEFSPISILKNFGTKELILLIGEKVKEKFECTRETPVITRQRHRNYVLKTLEHLVNFNINKPIELISEDLRLASLELGKIIGVIDVEEILDGIFSTFCIGK
ncbi:MAG: tRNA uridine-5-carboxymethylaminomethyl(34) synthesis GTPase MnmE [Wolbachia endosymbiont of Fragariocoptes setiger]|nr:tRNA uridine-5-carboxymethylaminomethyl(34) synthesis GTPase MnmE [Wolbachia endosymbiont of Fragariocoptes setiger]